MTPDQARMFVIGSLIVVSATAVIDSAGRGQTPKPRLFIAGGVVYLVLGLGADFVPQIAGPLAILITITVLLNRRAAFDALNRRIGQ